jgi:pimeloyl-ACP methyl ester carboxylesterase
LKPRPPSKTPAPAWRSAAWRAHLKDVTLRGRSTHYLDIGDGPAVVLVHGVASAWAARFCNIPELAIDHRVIAVDLPGFGRSDGLSAARMIVITDRCATHYSLAAFLGGRPPNLPITLRSATFRRYISQSQ